ncbi:MAG: hypothetical protein SchgKO_01740 [Schleiferiaceae bacterium]
MMSTVAGFKKKQIEMNTDELRKKWYELVEKLSNQFSEGEDIDLDGILFLIGVQELGMGHKRFKKDEKVNIMHIAICRVLSKYGYYEYKGQDSDGWPHYENIEKLPPLKTGQQSLLMKEAVVAYFEEADFI